MKTTRKVLFALIVLFAIMGGLYQGCAPAQTPKSDTGLTIMKVATMPKVELQNKVLSQDSLIQDQIETINIKNDSITKLNIKIAKPEAGAKPIAWVDYFIGLIVICLVWFLSYWKKLATIQIPLIQRLVSETSSFLKKIQYITTGIGAAIPTILATGLITNPYIQSILGNIALICLTLAGFILFTKKDTTNE